MKTENLRVGNIVEDSGELFKVVRLETNKYSDWNGDEYSIVGEKIDQKGSYCFLDKAIGVSLTTEKLIELGFNTNYKKGYICIDLFPIMGHYGIEPINVFPV